MCVDNNLQLASLGEISRCPKLQELSLTNNKLRNPKEFANLTSINVRAPLATPTARPTTKRQTLTAALTPLHTHTHIHTHQTLRIDGNRFGKLDSFPTLPQLTELFLSKNPRIRHVGALGTACPSLEVLHVTENALADAAAFVGLEKATALRELSISGNPICDSAE